MHLEKNHLVKLIWLLYHHNYMLVCTYFHSKQTESSTSIDLRNVHVYLINYRLPFSSALISIHSSSQKCSHMFINQFQTLWALFRWSVVHGLKQWSPTTGPQTGTIPWFVWYRAAEKQISYFISVILTIMLGKLFYFEERILF